MKTKIFISYRRGDTAGFAYTIHERLARRFGEDRLFMDVDSIGPGADFVEVIEKALSASAVVLALIGQRWSPERLHKPNDFVRLELVSALKYGTLIIPVLLEDREMPGASELPDELAPLVRRNAFEVRHNSDINRLVESLARLLSQNSLQPREPVPNGLGTEIQSEPPGTTSEALPGPSHTEAPIEEVLPAREEPPTESPEMHSTVPRHQETIIEAQSVPAKKSLGKLETALLLLAILSNFVSFVISTGETGSAIVGGICFLLAYIAASIALALKTIDAQRAQKWLLAGSSLALAGPIPLLFRPPTELIYTVEAMGLTSSTIYLAFYFYYRRVARRPQ